MTSHTYTRLDGAIVQYDDAGDTPDPADELRQAIEWGEMDLVWNLQHGGTNADLARVLEWLAQDRAQLAAVLQRQERIDR